MRSAADHRCPECGHGVAVHAAPRSQLVECIDCTIEETAGRRTGEHICRLRFDGGIRSIVEVHAPSVWDYALLIGVGLAAVLCAARLAVGVSGAWRTLSVIGLVLNLVVLAFGTSLLMASRPRAEDDSRGDGSGAFRE
jgi:hypothetical protein